VHVARAGPPRQLLPIIVLASIVITALVVAALLVWPSDGGNGDGGRATGEGSPSPSTAVGSAPLPLSTVSTLDPAGDGENDDEAGRAIDDNPTSFWGTTGYRTRAFGDLKAGLGLVVTVPPGSTVSRVAVTSPTRDWSYQVFLADEPKGSVGEWGVPAGEVTHVGEDQTTVEFPGQAAGAVLVWITDLGDAPPLVHAQIAEITVFA
jgi:hypothetical protein